MDGGGAGRDAGDDKRIELSEWMKGYKGVGGYGFQALSGLNDKAAANTAWAKMVRGQI